MERYVILKKHKARSLQLIIFLLHDRCHCLQERPELKLSSHGRKMTKFGRPALEIEGLVAASGLSPLIACSLDTSDRGLISVFVECWHKETSSFHLPVGEVTITLDDMASLLHLPIVGTKLLICCWNYSRSALQRRELRRFSFMALMFDYHGCETRMRRRSRHVTGL